MVSENFTSREAIRVGSLEARWLCSHDVCVQAHACVGGVARGHEVLQGAAHAGGVLCCATRSYYKVLEEK